MTTQRFTRTFTCCECKKRYDFEQSFEIATVESTHESFVKLYETALYKIVEFMEYKCFECTPKDKGEKGLQIWNELLKTKTESDIVRWFLSFVNSQKTPENTEHAKPQYIALPKEIHEYYAHVPKLIHSTNTMLENINKTLETITNKLDNIW